MAIDCLQQAYVDLDKGRVPRIANLAREDGMRLTCAAFAVILKYSESVDKFSKIVDELDVVSIMVSSEVEQERIKEMTK